MPSPPPDMVNILSHLKFRELDEDLTGLTNINVQSSQAADMLNAEATTYTECLFLTLMLGIVNQNAILRKQVESLKDDLEESITKSTMQATSTTNHFERIEGRLTATPNTTPLLHPPPPTCTPLLTTTSPSLIDHYPSPPTQKSYQQAAQENLKQYETDSARRRQKKPTNTPEKPKDTPTFPAFQHQFYAMRSSPTPIPAANQIAAKLSIEFGQVLDRSKQVTPVTALTVSISARGTIRVLPPRPSPLQSTHIGSKP
ncbi:hypothetical protein P167DRAFT_579324 [Morchella conica CCBAS932]|uniref:Uncharacterized protein n=1 Tax=Morchella conica CCBAS932 TaxID=1392247 RepID=A0A3N4KDG0_9PEZI|nr:hypothetical protein P167DRAFT_579324 [Morchella conica CCBAS932]